LFFVAIFVATYFARITTDVPGS